MEAGLTSRVIILHQIHLWFIFILTKQTLFTYSLLTVGSVLLGLIFIVLFSAGVFYSGQDVLPLSTNPGWAQALVTLTLWNADVWDQVSCGHSCLDRQGPGWYSECCETALCFLNPSLTLYLLCASSSLTASRWDSPCGCVEGFSPGKLWLWALLWGHLSAISRGDFQGAVALCGGVPAQCSQTVLRDSPSSRLL